MNLVSVSYGTATAPPGSINLAAYPALTYAPAQHGPGIRLAHNGKPVDEVLGRLSHYPDIVGAIDGIASDLGVSFADVLDALKYLRDQKRT